MEQRNLASAQLGSKPREQRCVPPYYLWVSVQKGASGRSWPHTKAASEALEQVRLCPIPSNYLHLHPHRSSQLGSVLAGRRPAACIPHTGPITVITIFSVAVKSN